MKQRSLPAVISVLAKNFFQKNYSSFYNNDDKIILENSYWLKNESLFPIQWSRARVQLEILRIKLQWREEIQLITFKP